MSAMQQQKRRPFADNRFINNSLAELQAAQRTPISGYQHLPLLPLEQATKEIIPLVPGLVDHVAKAKEECNQNNALLTWDEAAAIYLYTMPTVFSSHLNKALRDENRQALKPWFAYLRLIIHALGKLPSLKTDVWRGVAEDIGSNLHKNDDLTWWSVNSCSKDPTVVEFYLGERGTLFDIRTLNGKDISSFSAFPMECEVVLMPGTDLCLTNEVVNCRGHLFIVKLDETPQPSVPSAFRNSMVQRVTDCPPTPQLFLAPISGYDTVPLVSLKEAVQPLASLLPAVQSYAYSARMNCTNPADDLTPDESAAIMLYTMGWEPLEQCLYYALNNTLRSVSRKDLRPWFAYLKLLLTALSKLPLTTKRTIYRGVKADFHKLYPKGDTVVWWGFTSCTTSIDVLNSELFLGKTGSRVKFDIETDSGIRIRNHSYYKTEDEVLLLPGRQFKVLGCLDPGNGLYVIQLQETQPPTPLLQPVTIEHTYPDGSRYRGNFKGGKKHGTGTYEYVNGEVYRGEWANDQTNGRGIRTFPSGNRYEGSEKDGKRHGYGVNEWANGEKYEGFWANDKMNGRGKYTWPTNIEYEGAFSDHKKHGPGILTYANGRVEEGIWENEQLKERSLTQHNTIPLLGNATIGTKEQYSLKRAAVPSTESERTVVCGCEIC